MPTAGPTRSQVVDQATPPEGTKPPFTLVEVDEHAIAALAHEPNLLDQIQQFDRGMPPAHTIGVGDTVSVVLWQSANSSIFGDATASVPVTPVAGTPTAAGAQTVSIPEQVVGTGGTITIPFIGALRVAGRTTGDVQNDIQARLEDRAFHPQAIVTVTKNLSDSVTIAGEGVNAARVPLSPRGDRLLDVIATVGGSKSEPFETAIAVTRQGETKTVLLSRLITHPTDNIYVWPGDVISLIRQPRTYSVFGATQTNTQVPFGAESVDLAQAIAKAGGLQDPRADPNGIFLFRFEPPPVTQALGVPPAPTGDTRVVYHLNLDNIASYFLAQQFAMRDNDIIYSANAPMSDLQKFFTLVGTITGPIIGGVVVTQSVGRH